MEENRTPIGESGLIELMAKPLKNDKQSEQEKEELIQWCARAFANLSFDHEENRKVILNQEVLPILIDSLSSKNDTVLRNCAGCIANLSSQTRKKKI